MKNKKQNIVIKYYPSNILIYIDAGGADMPSHHLLIDLEMYTRPSAERVRELSENILTWENARKISKKIKEITKYR
jgi:hypothetical protein